MSDNSFWEGGGFCFPMKIIFLSPKNKFSDVSKTYNDVGNGQKFELKPSRNKSDVYRDAHLSNPFFEF